MNVSRADQIKFMRAELAMREETYPLKVKMKRMTEKEAELGLASTRAVLASLEAVPPVPAPAEPIYLQDERVMKLLPVIQEIYTCACGHRNTCIHCGSYVNILEEMGYHR